jgi:hypothetical protein
MRVACFGMAEQTAFTHADGRDSGASFIVVDVLSVHSCAQIVCKRLIHDQSPFGVGRGAA